jgi:hypothetical protein
MGAEDRIEVLNKECRPTGKMLQGPGRDTVRARRIAQLEAPDGFLNLVWVGQLSFAGRGLEIRLQGHVNQLD